MKIQKILKTETILLALILLLSFTLLIHKITDIPSGFYTDEAAIGYNAYKLLTTGRDEHNKTWPIFFKSLGDYRTPIPIYSNIPSIILFGLSEFSVRFTTAMYGAGTVFLLYFIGKKLSNIKVGLLSSFLLAISPWHIHMSRWGSEYASFPFFLSAGFLLYLISFKKRFYLLFAFIFLGLTLYTYYPAWAIVPLFTVGLTVHWVIINRFKHLLYLIAGVFLLLLISIPLIEGIKDGYALTRWKSIQPKGESFKVKIDKFFPLYIDHFREGFLFVSGDIGYPGHFITRHSVKYMGELYWFQAPFIIIGIIYFIVRNRKYWVLTFYLLLLYPLGSALTFDGPTATRSIIGIIPLTLFAALGAERLFSKIKRIKLNFLAITALVLVVLISFYQYLYRYYYEYPIYSSDYWGWQYGAKDITAYFTKVQGNYDELYMTGDFNGAYIFVPFYTFNRYPKIKAGWMKDNYKPSKKQVFAVKPHEIEQQGFAGRFKTLKDLYYPDGSIAITIGEVVNK